MDKYLLILGKVPKSEDIKKNNKGFMQYAAETYQAHLINGLEKNDVDFKGISAPFVGSFPINYKKIYFKKYNDEDKITFVKFNNVWGYRNISRYFHLKKEIKRIYKNYKFNKVIIYSPHTPFVKTAKMIKKIDNNIEICLIVPDLPQYMNLKEKVSKIYKICKKIDIKQFYNNLDYVDKFVYLTEYMKNIVGKSQKPYIVVEGIATEKNIKFNFKRNEIKKIVYTGLLNKKFGIELLIEAFKLIPDSNIELHLYGTGDYIDYIKEQCTRDTRIFFHGTISHEKALLIQKEADVLINPRHGNDEYLKYSFPSKTIEYIASGNPVVSYALPGIPDEYSKILYIPKNEEKEELSQLLKQLCNLNLKEKETIFEKSQNFIKKKNSKNIAKKIIEFMNM